MPPPQGFVLCVLGVWIYVLSFCSKHCTDWAFFPVPLNYYMFASLCVSCAHVCKHVCMYTCTFVFRLLSPQHWCHQSSFPLIHFFILLNQGLSLNPELIHLVSVSQPGFPVDLISGPPVPGLQKAPHLPRGLWESTLWSLWLNSKQYTHWGIFPVLILTVLY